MYLRVFRFGLYVRWRRMRNDTRVTNKSFMPNFNQYIVRAQKRLDPPTTAPRLSERFI